MRFKSLKVAGWRQFDDVQLEFHPRLTILAGSNGAGKSTLLRILSQHFGVNYSLLATPVASGKTGTWSYIFGLFDRSKKETEQNNAQSVGRIDYWNDHSSRIIIPQSGSISYNVQIENMMSVDGLYIASHRPVNNYQAISNIPTNAINAQQAYQSYSQEVQNKYNNGYTQFSPVYRIKEAIISMATFGPGNKNVQKNDELEATYEEFKIVLAKILPKSIGFVDISIRIPDVVIVTKTGEFVIDAASGGLMALIDIAWQIFLYSRGKSEFSVLIDEPENHLHPSMQRNIISNLISAFPNAQLIIATHSPFVVSSVRDSHVYALRYRDGEFFEGVKSAVYSEKLDNVNKAGPASEILRSVLGVPVTLPLWAEDQIEQIASEYSLENLNAGRIAELRLRLNSMGLGEFYSDLLSRMSKQ
ncbi:AAA family ATPase [Asticcacaulis sp. ZE23SCel15]|uniref:AAA family ATPase n=1 Tax=Asticcacaulis sp. ZE23SCel15 TaxID=3059027 RepID=UPI00265EE8AD|nr:AAA family ATPase [Asticcacaulis sp. ZE23SCel15]WKL57763.1 AAA family ATPase [Asticcacaulis sp. ZE23SCel15]